MAKAGWYNGNPSIIYNSSIDEVLQAYQFEIMTRDFDATSIQMNTES